MFRGELRQRLVDHRDRYPEVRQEVEADARKGRFRDSDDREWMAVEADRLADGLRRGAESFPPQPVADDGDRMGAGHAIVRGEKQPPACGPRAEQLEEAPADQRSDHSLRGPPGAAREVERLAFVVSRDAGERRRGVAIVGEDGVGGVHERDAFDVGPVDPNQGRRVSHRERAEEDRVHDREDGDVGPDAQSEGQHREHGEARAAPEHPDGVSEVLSGDPHERASLLSR